MFELLTGQRPFSGSRGRAIVPRPSSAVEPSHSRSVAGMSPTQLRRDLVGDLDAIVSKALDPDPSRRYRTAEAFSSDIRRSQMNLPISARRISPPVLAIKFVQRHRVAVLMGISLVLSFIAGGIGIIWEAIRAEEEATRATTTKDFLISIFRSSDPRMGEDRPRGEVATRNLLDASSKNIEVAFSQQPATQVELLSVTAEIYLALEETERARDLYLRSTTLAKKVFGPQDIHVIEGLMGQAAVYDAEGNDQAALKLLDAADTLIHRQKLDNGAVRARWWLLRGEALMSDAARSDAAEVALTTAITVFRQRARGDPLYSDALLDLGNVLLQRARFIDAADYYREAISIGKRNSGMEGNLLQPYTGLALALRRIGDFSGASAAFSNGSKIAERTFGKDSDKYWAIASDWALFQYERGDRRAALSAFSDLIASLATDRSEFRSAAGAIEAAEAMRKYGRCLTVDGQSIISIPLLERAEKLLTLSSASWSDKMQMRFDIARAYEEAGRATEARILFREALTVSDSPGTSPWFRAAVQERWGRFLLSQGELADAAMEFQKVLEYSRDHLTEPAIYARAGIAAVATRSGKIDTALVESDRAVAGLAGIEGSYDIRIRPYVWIVRARALLVAGDAAEAEQFARRARDAALLEFSPKAKIVEESEALLVLASRKLEIARVRQ